MESENIANSVLVGRELELEQLQQYLQLAAKGEGTTVFISGEAGAGKTRLTHEFLEIAKKKGAAAAVGWCFSNSTIPYFPFLEAFDTYFASDSQEIIDEQPLGTQPAFIGPIQVENVPQRITTWLSGTQQFGKYGKQTLTPQAWKDQTFAAVAKTLHWMSSREPLVLLLEDVHWADSASLALLYYIARAVRGERILVVATFRNEALTVDAEGHPHPLAETIRLMRREDLFKEISLSNLDDDSILKMTSNMIGGSLSPELVEKLSEESRGNPLFIIESLRMLLEQKNLVEDEGKWRLTVEKLGIPNKIKDIILRRLSILNFNQRRILDAASVIGEKFDIELLGAVLGQDSLQVLETLNQIAQSTSLVSVEENYYRFDHAKSREALYEEIPLPLKRGYHARIAQRIEETGKIGRLPLGDLAYHYAEAGNKVKSVTYSLAAGRDSLARWSNNEAIRQFSFVLQSIGEESEHYDERISALEGLGDAYYSNSMYQHAENTFELLISIGTGVVKLRAFRKAMDAAFFKFDFSTLIKLVEKAEEYSALDRLENARIQVNRSRINLFLKRSTPDPLGVVEKRLKIFEEEYSFWDTAIGLLEVGNVASLEGARLLEKGLAAYLRSIALFDELGDLRWQARTRLRLATSYPLVVGAVDLIRKSIELFEKIGEFGMLAEAYASLASIIEAKGDLEEAVSYSLRALEHSKKTDSTWALGIAYSNLVRQYSRIGDQAHAEEYFQKLTSLTGEAEALANPTNVTLGVLFAGKSLWNESNQYFKNHFDFVRARRRLSSSNLAASLMSYAWALEKQGKTEEAKEKREEANRIAIEFEENVAHVSIQTNLMAPWKVAANEEFETRLDIVNTSRETGSLIKVENMLPSGSEVEPLSSRYNLKNQSLEMKKHDIEGLQVETVKLSLKALKSGTYTLNPTVTYADELGEVKNSRPNPIVIVVEPSRPSYETLAGRITTGFKELDVLLLGGIPEEYTVALTSPSSDERDLLIRRFLEAGASGGEITFYVAADSGWAKSLAEKYPSSFFLLLCNPQAEALARMLPNVIKLKGVESLTEIDIALTKAIRMLNSSTKVPKRICIDILSDVLLQHHAVTTRRWLGSLLSTLKLNGFTVLAVIDPTMHPIEEAQAILGLFDGEISISEKETSKGHAKFLRIKKMTGQKYLKDEMLFPATFEIPKSL